MKANLRTMPAAVFGTVAMAVCASLAAAADTGIPTQAPVGATFVRVMKSTGSYGSGETVVTSTRMPPRTWKGSEVGVWQQQGGPTLLMGPDASFVALLDGETPLFTYDPPTSYRWPLSVGKTWSSRWTLTDHAKQQATPMEVNYTVEAYEDVSVPAGTFKGYRIRSTDNLGNEDLRWVSTELGIWIKEQLVRTDRHPAGPGTRETELQSQTIRK